MNFGTRAHDTQTKDIHELSERLKKAGIYNIQLALKKSMPNFKEGSFSPLYAKNIGKIFYDNNINISVLGCYINPSCTDRESLKNQLEFFVENLKFAKFMGADMVGLETGFVGEKLNIEENRSEEVYQYLLKNMKYLVSMAEKLGVMIGIEGVSCFVVNDCKKMKRLLDDLDSPNVCVIFDPVNLLDTDNYTDQDSIIKEAFEILGDKIGVIHLKDFTVENGYIKECIAGKGMLNTELLLAMAEKVKPGIPVIFELVSDELYQNVVSQYK